MPTTTTNYNLVKPLQDEFYDVDVFNGNADAIDAALKDIDTAAKAKVSVPATSTQNNVVVFGANGQIKDSGVKLADKADAKAMNTALQNINTALATKVTAPTTATQGNVVAFGAGGQIADSGVKMSQKANTPVTKNFTLQAAKWSGSSYTLATGMFTGSNPAGDIGLATGATEAQYAACAMASLSIVTASSGNIVLRANGAVPEINLPVTVEVRT